MGLQDILGVAGMQGPQLQLGCALVHSRGLTNWLRGMPDARLLALQGTLNAINTASDTIFVKNWTMFCVEDVQATGFASKRTMKGNNAV